MKKYFIPFIVFATIIYTAADSPFQIKQDSTAIVQIIDTTLTMPYNKILKPAGEQIIFGDSALENHALDVALSPDGKTLAVESRYSVVFVNTSDNKILYDLKISKYDKSNGMSTYSGIIWLQENDKQYVLWGTRNKLMQAEWNGQTGKIVNGYEFPPKKGVAASLPNEMVIKKENGNDVVYLVLNGNDEVVKLNLNSGKIIWQKPVGLAPYGITMAKEKLFVSDWSGIVPSPGDKNTAGIPWEEAKVNKFGAVSSGAVSVLNPVTGNTIKVINVGLHPNKIISSSDQKFVFVANGNDDNISVINTKTNRVSETISVRLNHARNPYYGDSPNGLALSPEGKTLYVANGMDDALAVISLGKKASANSLSLKSKILGFIPTAAYPGGVILGNNNMLYVADIEGFGAILTTKNKNDSAFKLFNSKDGKFSSTAGAFNTHRMLAVVSVIPVPDNKTLETDTKNVIKNNAQKRLALLTLLPRKNIKPVPVPQHIGEPSVFKHVVYIIRENRTYDQILGDVKKGNGDTALCTFGEKVTPNVHNLVKDFVLLDNYRASGKCSAEGHVWTDASITTDYIEKNVRAWFRSYTHVLYDAMAYPKTGFLWDDAMDHGKSVRIYGETAIPRWNSGEKWTGIYKDYLNGKPFKFTNYTTIERVRGILAPDFPGYDNHNITDQIRAEAFISELKKFEQEPGDHFPDLTIMALPNDHTAGTAPGFPTPRAMVADNDLALGKIIDALTHSRFWENTVVFITEDDSQDGWDHVSAYRTVGLIISPYTRNDKVVSTEYNQTSLIRTIEQILGIPPMNIEDATAKPMFNVFSDKPDLTPYTFVSNFIPLNEMNPPLSSLNGIQRHYAKASLEMSKLGIDMGNDDLLNHIIWSSVKKDKDYPAKYAGKDDKDN